MKNYKLFFIVLLVLTFLLAASGCGLSNETTTGEGADLTVSSGLVGFEEVASFKDNDVTYIYYRCRTTDVMFVYRESRGHNGYSFGGFTAMPDPKTNGPLIYDNWLAYLESGSDNN